MPTNIRMKSNINIISSLSLASFLKRAKKPICPDFLFSASCDCICFLPWLLTRDEINDYANGPNREEHAQTIEHQDEDRIESA